MNSTEHDWTRADAMTEAEIHAAAMSDPDALPLTDEDLERMKRTPRVRVIRRAFRLSQEEFADQFRIPIGTLRDWEQGRKEPDAAARAYLRVIAVDPVAVLEALRPMAHMAPKSRYSASSPDRRPEPASEGADAALGGSRSV
jgi:putative transcriptional regulator